MQKWQDPARRLALVDYFEGSGSGTRHLLLDRGAVEQDAVAIQDSVASQESHPP